MTSPRGHFKTGEYLTSEKLNSALWQTDSGDPDNALIPYEGLLYWDSDAETLQETDGEQFTVVLGDTPTLSFAGLSHHHLDLSSPDEVSSVVAHVDYVEGTPLLNGAISGTMTLSQTKPNTIWLLGIWLHTTVAYVVDPPTIDNFTFTVDEADQGVTTRHYIKAGLSAQSEFFFEDPTVIVNDDTLRDRSLELRWQMNGADIGFYVAATVHAVELQSGTVVLS